MDNPFFRLDGGFYQQVIGTRMGSPLPPAHVDMVMDDFEKMYLNNLSFKPPFDARYVDYTLAIILRNKLGKILRILNSDHNRLQFTHKTDEDGTFNFLEVALVRNGKTLITD